MDPALLRSLRRSGARPLAVPLDAASTLLLLPHGGRVLGLFSAGDRENFLWVNPALRKAESARALFASSGWHNPGGSRIWIAPEVDFFLPRYPEPAPYVPPRALDAAEFRATRGGGRPVLQNSAGFRSYRHRSNLRLRIRREFFAAPDPLRHERPAGAKLRYAGYREESLLRALRPARPLASAGLWHLLQFPHGGEMLVPTYGTASPRVYFGRIPAADLKAAAGCLRYRMRSAGEHKIGLVPEVCTGRAGYFRASAGRAQVVIANFAVRPSENYIDAPAWDPEGRGCAFEACSVNNPRLGRFAELEIHAPVPPQSRAGGVLSLEIWAYRGPPKEIAAVCRRLLGHAPRI